jgi:hypothetical protein
MILKSAKINLIMALGFCQLQQEKRDRISCLAIRMICDVLFMIFYNEPFPPHLWTSISIILPSETQIISIHWHNLTCNQCVAELGVGHNRMLRCILKFHQSGDVMDPQKWRHSPKGESAILGFIETPMIQSLVISGVNLSHEIDHRFNITLSMTLVNSIRKGCLPFKYHLHLRLRVTVTVTVTILEQLSSLTPWMTSTSSSAEHSGRSTHCKNHWIDWRQNLIWSSIGRQFPQLVDDGTFECFWRTSSRRFGGVVNNTDAMISMFDRSRENFLCQWSDHRRCDVEAMTITSWRKGLMLWNSGLHRKYKSSGIDAM